VASSGTAANGKTATNSEWRKGSEWRMATGFMDCDVPALPKKFRCLTIAPCTQRSAPDFGSPGGSPSHNSQTLNEFSAQENSPSTTSERYHSLPLQ